MVSEKQISLSFFHYKSKVANDPLGWPVLTQGLDWQVTPMLPTKFQVNWPIGSGEAKNRFSRWRPWRPSWISDQNDFSYF